MYFWNIDELKQTLVTTGLDTQTSFYYVLIYVVLATLGFEVNMYMPQESYSIWDYLNTTANIMLAVVGLSLFYIASGGKTGKQLLERFFSIGLVVLIRLLPLLFILSLALGVFLDPLNTTPVESLVLIGWSIYYYYLIIKHVGDVANAKSPEDSPQQNEPDM